MSLSSSSSPSTPLWCKQAVGPRGRRGSGCLHSACYVTDFPSDWGRRRERGKKEGEDWFSFLSLPPYPPPFNSARYTLSLNLRKPGHCLAAMSYGKRTGRGRRRGVLGRDVKGGHVWLRGEIIASYVHMEHFYMDFLWFESHIFFMISLHSHSQIHFFSIIWCYCNPDRRQIPAKRILRPFFASFPFRAFIKYHIMACKAALKNNAY